MRPYVIEVIFAFAAGFCVGAWFNDQQRREEKPKEPIIVDQIPYNGKQATEKPDKEEKKGWYVNLDDGKLVIDPKGRKKRFFFF